MNIDFYHFGEMVIDGEKYNADLVISSGNIHTGWYRQEGHTIRLSDLEKWIPRDCERLILGTGASGLCKVPPEIEIFCKEHSIELITHPTTQAVEAFNSLSDKSKTVAAFHLTC